MAIQNILLTISNIYERAGLPSADASKFTERAMNLVFIAAGAITIYIILSAGFKYVTSGGNAENTKKAAQTIIFGFVGLFLILMSYTIIRWVFKIGGA